MKVRLIRQITHGNVTSVPGDEIEVSDLLGKVYVSAGWAEEVQAPKEEGDEPKTKRARK